MVRRSSCRRFRRSSPRRRGALVVLAAIMLCVVVSFVALSVDLGYVCSVKTDLQAAADSGALAGSGVVLEGEGKAIATAERFARYNLDNPGVKTGGKQIVEVELGHWDYAKRKFFPGRKPADAVHVTTRVDNSSLFFARAIGRGMFSSEASAIAAYRPRDIMLVLDVSGSMAEARGGIRKIDELREAVRAFLGYVGEAKAKDRVGFSYYSSTADIGSRLSFDLKSVEQSLINRLKPSGWTNIADGMQLALNELARNGRPEATPLMVVLTDGAANLNQPGNWYDPGEAKRRVINQAEAAQDQQIPVFTIALDSLTDEVDVALMQRVANITGSESYHIIAGEKWNGGSKLREAFRRVAINRPLRIVD